MSDFLHVHPKEKTQLYIGSKPEVTLLGNGRLILYSAESMRRSGQTSEVSYSSVSLEKGISVDLLMRLSPEHKPMDAIAVFIQNDGTIRWAKADGVSNVGVRPNDSALLSDKLVRQIANATIMDDPYPYIENVDSYFRDTQGKFGASTLEYGEIKPDAKVKRWNVRTFRIASNRGIDRYGETSSGDLGVTENYTADPNESRVNELWDTFDFQKRFVSGEGNRGVTENFYFSGDNAQVLTTATDGIRSKVDGRLNNSGMQMDHRLQKARDSHSIPVEIKRAQKEGIVSAIDDISMLSIKLPKLYSTSGVG